MQAVGSINGWQGMNSGVDPEFLPDNVAFQSYNTVSRGGKIRTRPGFTSIYNAPSGFPQGITFFTPNNGVPHLVFACGGYVFASPEPFREYYMLSNVKFSPTSRHVVFQVCEQTTDYTDDGVFYFLNRPRNILIMQDGNTPAAFWDGTISRHLNPEKSFQEFTPPGKDETPLGLWMAWVADRLVVFRGSLGFASDLGNPLKFTETQYLAEARAFSFPGEVTGAVQPNSGSPLLVFTNNTRTSVRVDIRDRTKWLDTDNFFVTDYDLGCVSGKSIVKSFGQTWWFSGYGITNLNYAYNLNLDSKFRYLDEQMAISKSKLSPVLEGICAASYENYLLFSTPAYDLYNRHTWVLDQSNTPDGGAVWDSIWTGIRPVAWASGRVGGEERLFCLSLDRDGVNRIWEAFSDNRDDNGCAIQAFVETKRWNAGSKDTKQFEHARLFMDDLSGTIDLAVDYAGDRGGYKRILTTRLESTKGSVQTGFLESFLTFVPQSRVIKSPETERGVTGCDSCNIEGTQPNDQSTAFSATIAWSGDASMRGIQLFYIEGDTNYEPECPTDEEGERIVTQSGCSYTSRADVSPPNPYFTSTQTVTVTCPSDQRFTSTATETRTSIVSQQAADDAATCAATEAAWATMPVECPNVQ